LRALDHRDHAVDERLAGIRGDAHDYPVRQHARTAGDGREVAARLADDRRGLTGDRAPGNGRRTLDDLAIARDVVTRLYQHDVVLAQLTGADLRVTRAIARLHQLLRHHGLFQATQCRGLRLTTP